MLDPETLPPAFSPNVNRQRPSRYRKRVYSVLVALALSICLDASAAVRYVKSDAAPGGNGLSWQSPFTTIQAGVNSANLGDEVWVATGVYTGSTQPVVSMKINVSIFGGFSGTETQRAERDASTNQTIIDGESVRRCVVAADNTILDGFIIQSGSASIGGGILVDGATIVFVRDCLFLNCTAGNFGAAMYVNQGSFAVSGCTFAYNVSSFAGGAVYIVDSSAHFGECLIVGNESASGAAIAISQTTSAVGTLALSGCRITNNVAVGSGGAVSATGSRLLFEETTFSGNSASNLGGALLCTLAEGVYSTSLSIGNCTFRSNRAANGAAAYLSQATGTVNSTEFTGNSASATGGGAYVMGNASNLSFTECSFEGNDVRSTGTPRAGALFVSGGSSTYTKCRFIENASDLDGGAAYVTGASTVNMLKTVFTGNTAFSGSAIHLDGSNLTFHMTNCLLTSNSGSSGTLNILNGADARIVNCTFARNAAYSGSAFAVTGSSSVVDLAASILWAQQYSPPIELIGGAVLNIDLCTIPTPEGFGGIGNIDGDPLFFDAANDDYRLATGSPAIDAVTVPLAFAPVDDIRDTARPQGSARDMGAYESLPVEDTDDDGISDSDEGLGDTDADGTPNYIDTDSDNDGILDTQEIVAGLDPTDRDDAEGDSDGDTLSNRVEALLGTNALDPDTDNDTIDDGLEVANNLDPLNASDAQEDADNDGLSNAQEVNTYRTNPRDTDSDNDGDSDGAEVAAGSNPLGGNGITPFGDVDGDGEITAIDVQLVINAALGI